MADTLDRPELILTQRVSETSLSVRAKNSIARRLGAARWSSLTIEELVGFHVSSLNIRTSINDEILDFLGQSGLRMNLERSEIDFYRQFGHLPPISAESGIRVLCLSHGSTRALAKWGIVRLRHMNEISLAELARADGMGKVRLGEIERAFRRLNLPIYRDKQERCSERLQTPDAP